MIQVNVVFSKDKKGNAFARIDADIWNPGTQKIVHFVRDCTTVEDAADVYCNLHIHGLWPDATNEHGISLFQQMRDSEEVFDYNTLRSSLWDQIVVRLHDNGLPSRLK
jgi:hypothetical protein